MSVRGADKELKQYVLNQDDYVWLGEEYKRKSRLYPRTIHAANKKRRLFYRKAGVLTFTPYIMNRLKNRLTFQAYSK